MKVEVIIICKVAIHMALWIGLRKLISFDFEYSSNIQLRLKNYIYVNHIAICLGNSVKCWFKHPLPYPVWSWLHELPSTMKLVENVLVFYRKLHEIDKLLYGQLRCTCAFMNVLGINSGAHNWKEIRAKA
jgi:hypothetical protein